ncbi:MAG TPA: RnfABCDGE type electron transport complex subunit D [Spirochaetota bacterium]|nr:RnfABCDGE type electron transport complex subunit D [Spirochaetota bacterium]HPH03009.1 RnfABCDGE type electron transport complex subunit D [Spirochaetota bacterium]HPN82976.1 RnfABCDGE type electron transport complex subunit D [Spirochaetota bacterium]
MIKYSSEDLVVSSGPHLRTKLRVPVVMWLVSTTLIPAIAWAGYAFGPWVLIVTAVSVLAAVLTEFVITLLLGKPQTVTDGSAFLTGLLVACNMPATEWGVLPLYVPIVGSIFAIAVAKHAFGGLGQNWINPALAGRIFVFFAWLPAMTGGWAGSPHFDAVSSATPLNMLKFRTGILPGDIQTTSDAVLGMHLSPTHGDLFFGMVPGCIGEISALALLVGGLILIVLKIVQWEIPLFYIASTALFSWIFGGLAVAGQPQAFFSGDALYHILSGGVILGAFYMATDWVTTPVSFGGRIIFGLGCGALTVLIRLTGSNVEGVSFAIVLMNITVPLIDRLFSPQRFGLPEGRGV